MNIGFQVRVLGVIDVPEDWLQCGQLFSFIFQERCSFQVLQILSILLR